MMASTLHMRRFHFAMRGRCGNSFMQELHSYCLPFARQNHCGVASYTRLCNVVDDVKYAQKGSINCSETWHQQGFVEAPLGQTVKQAIENYRKVMSRNQHIFDKVNHIVYQEAERCRSDTTATYEICGNYAYFMHNPGHKQGGHKEYDNEDIGESSPALVRVKLKHPQRHRRKRQNDISDLNIRTDQAVSLVDFSAIESQGDICSIEGMRISPYRNTGAILSVMHRSNDNILAASFVNIRMRRERVPIESRTRYNISSLICTAKVSRIGELHFMPHGNTRDKHLLRVIYTLVDEKERAWQVRRMYIHTGKGYITNDRQVYTDLDHGNYLSLYKSKDGKILFIAVVKHNGTRSVMSIKNSKKLYQLPLLTDTKVILEHRGYHVYGIHNSAREVDQTDVYRSRMGYKRGKIYNEPFQIESVVSRIDTRLLRKCNRRGSRAQRDGANPLREAVYRASHWHTLKVIDNCIVTDVDRMARGLVMYCYVPPSSPRIMVLSFGDRSNAKRDRYPDNKSMQLYEVELPLKVGVIEPQPNSNINSNKVGVTLNAPGTDDMPFEIDLDRTANERNNDMLSPVDNKTDCGNSTESSCRHMPQTRHIEGILTLSKVNSSTLTVNYDRKDILSYIVYVHSRDGSCRIPVTLVRCGEPKTETTLKDFRETSSKCVVYVYGAYGERIKVNNDIEHKVLLALGYTLCFAHVRGGGELGPEWHKAGTLHNKHRGFHDLVDVLEFLLAKDIARRNKLGVITTSAGGIIAGALYNMRPDICSCILLKLPYLDVLNNISDATAVLTRLEHEEFGEPTSNVDHIYSYSPCSNPIVQEYTKPPLIIQCNSDDLRAPWQQSCSFMTMNDHAKSRMFLKVSPGIHMDGRDHWERLQQIQERISIMESLLG